MPLTPDPELGSRNDWRWCADCAALKEPWHIHGDPLEAMSRGELLELCRKQDLFIAVDDVGTTRFEDLVGQLGRGQGRDR